MPASAAAPTSLWQLKKEKKKRTHFLVPKIVKKKKTPPPPNPKLPNLWKQATTSRSNSAHGFSFSFNPCFDQNSPMTIDLEQTQNPPKKKLRQKTQQQHLANKKQNWWDCGSLLFWINSRQVFLQAQNQIFLKKTQRTEKRPCLWGRPASQRIVQCCPTVVFSWIQIQSQNLLQQTNKHPTKENCWSTQIWSSRRLKNHHRRRRHHHQKKKLRRSKEQNPKSPQFPHKLGRKENQNTTNPLFFFFSFFHFWMWISVLILIGSW